LTRCGKVGFIGNYKTDLRFVKKFTWRLVNCNFFLACYNKLFGISEGNAMLVAPKVKSSNVVYDGWLNVRVDELEIDGMSDVYPYEVITIGTSDGVAVLPFVNEETVLLSNQYRYPVRDITLGLIQGGIKIGECMFEAAQRELLEEVGLIGKIEYLNTMYPLPDTLDMRMHFFIATELEEADFPEENPLEEALILEVPFDSILSQVIAGKHKDSALVWAVMHYELDRRQKK
jgi:8-oxo-dGTP pyrophosphatase MutT (NUDIX family)